MDPIGIIVAALASGAAAGLKPTAEKAIKEAYAGLKSLIQRKYSRVDLLPIENKPESRSKRESVAEDLADAGAAGDRELLDLAKVLIDAVAEHDKATATVIGVDLEEVKAAYLDITKVTTVLVQRELDNCLWSAKRMVRWLDVGIMNSSTASVKSDG
jgi:hypothetical protein